MGADRDPRYRTQAWRKLRRSILARDRHQCQLRLDGCTGDARPIGGHVDHIVSPIDGGAFFDPSNLRASCPSCNCREGGRLGASRRRLANYPAPSRAWR